DDDDRNHGGVGPRQGHRFNVVRPGMEPGDRSGTQAAHAHRPLDIKALYARELPEHIDDRPRDASDGGGVERAAPEKQGAQPERQATKRTEMPPAKGARRCALARFDAFHDRKRITRAGVRVKDPDPETSKADAADLGPLDACSYRISLEMALKSSVP